jgi:hypothetical protein
MARNPFLVLGAALAVCIAVAANDDVFFEVEPNDVDPEVLEMGLGAQPGEPVTFRIKGRIDPAGDVDRFALELNAGDVVGVAITDTSGLDPTLCLENAVGDLVIGNDTGRVPGYALPPESPLPRVKGWGNDAGDAALYVVIVDPGVYVLEAAGEDGTTGRYRLDIVVARPGLEAHPVGTRQIVFVDFDGADVAMQNGTFAGWGGAGKKTFSPLADFLGFWGLSAADEDAVIDAVLATLEENLSTDIRARGLNGDYAKSGTPGEFDIEIRNSRDHADTYGMDPLVTRLVIGGTEAEAGIPVWGLASAIDPGNFSTADDAIVLLDRYAGLTPTPPGVNLNDVPIADGHTMIELVGRTLGNIGTHELGHVFGCDHTERGNYVVNLMDQGGPADLGAGATAVGPDGIFGTADDFDRDFGVDVYASVDFRGRPEPFRGVHDTLNTIAFGLSTGRK